MPSSQQSWWWFSDGRTLVARRRRDRRAARPFVPSGEGGVPRLRSDAQGPAHDARPLRREAADDRVPGGEDPRLPALPRPPQAAPLRGHRAGHPGGGMGVAAPLGAAPCPADCIRVVAAENTPENRVSAGERYAAVYEINLSRCIFCGYCEIACPFDAITMGHDYEMADYNRSDLIFTKEMLLAEPLERTPLRSAGE